MDRRASPATAPPITLGCLSHEEAVEAVAGNMAAFGHEIPRGCAAALAKASFGFPQHIHAYLEAAVGVIRSQGPLDEEANMNAAIERGNQRRIRYCQDRIRGMHTRTPFDAVVPIAAALDAQQKNALRESEASDVATTGRFDGEAVVDDAIAHGVLTRHPDGTVGFGIPSFRDYMADQLGLARLAGPQVAPVRTP